MTGRLKSLGGLLAGLLCLADTAIGQTRPQPLLRYRTVDQSIVALGFDVEADAIVELTRLAEYGPSVIQTVLSGAANRVIWRDNVPTECAPDCGDLGLEYSRSIGAYVVRVPVGLTNHIKPRVYISRDGESSRLIATSASFPGKSAAYRLRAGVLEINGWITAARVIPGKREVVLEVARSDESPRRYVLHVPANWQSREAGIRVREATEGDEPPAQSGPPFSAMSFEGCGSPQNSENYDLAGRWVTSRGSVIFSITQGLTKELNGRLVYGGVAQCLYEYVP